MAEQLIIARFGDPQEAHIAAGALVAQGYDATVRDGGYGAVDPLMRQATGGFPLMVPADQAKEAQAFLDSLRAPDPEDALKWRRHPKAVSSLLWAPIAFLQPEAALALTGARAGPGTLRFWIVILLSGLIAAMLVVIGALAIGQAGRH